ncbi:MAG: nucleotidyltransferase family protein [Ignavibacteriales bacterium]|nr:nucleotidyltransferase family protein [Ignavibacteriales bacterium]
MRAFILAAGLGTRLQPLTNNKPKALVEINGTPLLEIVITKLINSGFDQIIINVHHFAEQITSFLNSRNNFGIEIKISDESGMLLDTGGGLKNAAWFFDDSQPFLVHNVDVLTNIDLRELYNFHLQTKSLATLAVQKRNSSRYFLFDEEKNLCGWQNIKTTETKITRDSIGKLEQFAFSGIHIADPAVLKMMPEEKVFSLVDFYLSIAKENRITYFAHSNSLFIDLGKKENLIEAKKYL